MSRKRDIGITLGAAASFLAAALVAAQTPSAPKPSAPARPKAPAADTAPLPASAVVETDAGSFTIRFLPDLAPAHVRFFAKTARAGGFDGTTFHRIIAGGIIQGGDPLSKDPAKKALYGTGGLSRQAPWQLKAEFSERPMTRGSVAAVLLPGKPDSAGTQFFVFLADQLALTGKYTIFGEVSSGMEVVDKIGTTAVEGDRAAIRVEIKKVTLETASGS
jgi:cyclophilin family peptidyl-prolyl cis-trans isomerase